jgi:hypothetical protein
MGPRQILADARNAAVRPSLAAAVTTTFLLGAALAPHAPAAGRVVVAISLVVGVPVSAWTTGQWLTGGLSRKHFGLG